MKIICENCRTKYSIADEKVKGKVFKIRCKKCQNIIVVRGNEELGAEAPASSEAVGASDFGAPAAAGVWHLVVGRDQIGPITGDEVREKMARGEIDPDTYIWKEGFTDWVRLGSVEEFAGTVVSVSPLAMKEPVPAENWGQSPSSTAQGGMQAAAPSKGSAKGASAGGWGGLSTDNAPNSGGAEAGLFAAAGSAGGDLFGTGAPRARGASEQMTAVGADVNAASGAGLFGSAPAAGADMFAGGGKQVFPSDEEYSGGASAEVKMTGARHENSVLFSLSNLQALATGGAGKVASKVPSSTVSSSPSDGSGLIDIRAMASSSSAKSQTTSAEDSLPDLGGFSVGVVNQPWMPTVQDERPAWVLPTIIGIGATLLIAVGVLIVVLVTRKPEQVIVQQQVPTPAAVATPTPAAKTLATTPGVGSGSAAALKADSDKEKTEGDKTTKATTKSGGKRKSTGTKAVSSSSDNSAGSDTVDDEKPTKKPAGGAKHDALDDLIDGAIGGKGKAPKAPKPSAAPSGGGDSEAGGGGNLPETLGRSEIQAGMRNIKGKVQGCYDKYKVPGMANVQVTIGNNGRVSASKIKGIFAGTPTGACVQAAAKSATFPRFKGAPITIDYPFILR